MLLERQSGDAWQTVGEGVTNEDGRIPGLLTEELKSATYRITFQTAAYLKKRHGGGFYPLASIVFEVSAPDQHFHVPLLLSPFGYQTYRGS